MVSTETAPCQSDRNEGKALPGMERIDEPLEVPERLKIFNYLSGLNRAVGVLLIILVVAWIGQYRDGFGSYRYASRLFNWHPMLMVLGMVFLHSNGMLIYRTHRSIGMPCLKVIHAGIMIVCVLCTIIGLAVELQNHSGAGGRYFPNMYSLHSWVGLITVILFFSQCAAGFLSILYPEVRPDLQATFMEWHVYLGPRIFVGAVVASLLGFNEKAIFILYDTPDYLSENTMIWFIYLTLITFGGLSVYLVSQDRFKRLARPGDDDPVTREVIFGNLYPGHKPICCLPWTSNDCVQSTQIPPSPPNYDTLESVGTHVPPTLPTPVLNNLKDVD